MGEPVTVVVSGGVPVVDATPTSGTPADTRTTNGAPVTPVETGARPITIVASGAPPVVFISADGTSYLIGGTGTTLNLSASTFPENSALNTVIGTLSVSGGAGVYTYSLTSNPGTLFNISGSSLRVTSTTIAPGSYPVTIRADNGVDTPIDRVFLLTATAVSGGTPTTGFNDELNSQLLAVLEDF